MPSQYIYSVSASSNVDLSAQVRAYRTVMKANAEEGSVAISTVIVDDNAGGLNITGFRPFTWNETSESSNSTIIQHGYTADRDVSRGPFRITNSRQWSVNVADINSILNRRLVLQGSGDRPAETDVARMQWVISGTGLGTYVTDTTYLSTAAPVAMDANDYRKQRVLDVVDDCAQASGKNYFLLINELIAGKPTGIFYDFNSSTAYSSTVRLTNVLADVDSTTTYAVYNDDLKLNRDPSRVYSQIVVPFVGGDAFTGSDAIATNFFPRDVIAPQVNVHTAAKALARAARYIADASTEEDRLTMSYLVPLARVNRLREGHTYQVRFSHLPGYEAYTWVRALNRTVEAISEEFYKVTLEASPAAAATPATQSCSTIVSAMQTYDSGQQGSLNPSVTGPPVDVAPTSPSSYPSAVVGGFFTHRGDDTLGTDPVVTGLTVQSGGLIPNYAGNPRVATMGYAGYKALTSGSPGTWRLNWTVGNGGTERWRSMAVYIPTTATTPVQTGVQYLTGGTITLGAAPTPGNILVLVRMVETSPFGSVPVGYTQKVSGSFVTSSPGTFTIDICVRCVQTGDTALQTLVDTGFSHWQYLQEWAIT